MKKLLTVVCLLVTFKTMTAQYIAFNYSSKGFGWSSGATIKNINVNATADFTFLANDVPHNYGISAGYSLPLGENYSITPMMGVALSKYKDYSLYEKGGQIIRVKEKILLSSVEVERRFNEFGIYAIARYGNGFYAGVGFKVHFSNRDRRGCTY